MPLISFQPDFRPALPVVFGAKDDREFRATLTEMDRILILTGIEDRLILKKVSALGTALSAAQIQGHGQIFRRAFRHSILLSINREAHSSRSAQKTARRDLRPGRSFYFLLFSQVA